MNIRRTRTVERGYYDSQSWSGPVREYVPAPTHPPPTSTSHSMHRQCAR